MFGYVVADRSQLTEEQLSRYKGCYCGLCKSLKERHGNASRLTLNFDMTFLVLMLNSMYEPYETDSVGRCAVHPLTKKQWWQSEFSDYAADMNVALAYHNCLDDWQDGKKILSLCEAKLLKDEYGKVAQKWTRQCTAIENSLSRLAEIEEQNSPEPDAGANAFAELMGELFVCREDSWADRFRVFGQTLGRFIYMMDACVDFDRDRRHNNYNPLIAMGRESISDETARGMLTVLIGECAREFEKLPLIQDVDIMRNILYSGVWTQYELSKKRRDADDK